MLPCSNVQQYTFDTSSAQVSYISGGRAVTCRHFLFQDGGEGSDLVWIESPHGGREISGSQRDAVVGQLLHVLWEDHGYCKVAMAHVSRVEDDGTFAVHLTGVPNPKGLSGCLVWDGTGVAGIVTGHQRENGDILWVEKLPTPTVR